MVKIFHLGDITKIDGHKVPLVDVITGGSPCQDLSVAGKREGLAGERSGLFMEQIRIVKEMRDESIKTTAETVGYVQPRYMVWENVCFHEDTLITCDTGYKKISEVKVWDKVKTHLGRFMPVIKTYKHENKDVIRLRVSGSEDVIVTPNHPIWVREKKYIKGIRVISKPYWCPAGELTKHHLVAYVLDIPKKKSNITEAEAWALGRWLADGSVDLKKTNPRIFISCGLNKAKDTYKHLSELPYKVYENHPHETAINFCFTSADFYNKVIKDCGRGARNKLVPSWVFSLPIEIQKCVLEGYISGDGYVRSRGNQKELSAATVSRNLAYGISRLLRNVYHNSVSVSVSKPKDGMIGDRIIKANYPCYKIYMSLTNKVTQSYFDGNVIWQPVKEVLKETEKHTVYNLSVLEDNTYEANQFVGHNCGAYSSNNGADFQAVLQEICKVVCKNCPPIPIPKEGWHYSGNLDGVGDNGTPFSISWRLHDAQYWGVPQRRRRVCIVADFGGTTASKILFELWGETEQNDTEQAERYIRNEPESEVQSERNCLSRNTQESDRERKGTSETVENDIGETISFQERAGKPGGVKEYSSNESEQELSLPSTTNQSSIQDNSVCYGFEPGTARRLNPESRFSEEISPTLRANMGDNQASVVYGMSPYDSNAMKSSNPHSGVYEADTTKTLDLNGGNPACNQGGMMIVQSYGLDSHNVSISEEKTMTMLQGKNDNHNVPCVYGIDRASFNQGKNAKYDFAVEEEIAQPLVARGPGGVMTP